MPTALENTLATKEPKNSTKHVESAPITDHIQTSRLRNNALHDYEEGYRPITAVICLMDTDEYKILDEDDWQDYRLKLAVHEDEEEGWLILVYESGKVCKVSMAERTGQSIQALRWRKTHLCVRCLRQGLCMCGIH